MALIIETDEADALARELAAITHESLTEAVTTALRQRLERVRTSRIDIVRNLDRLRVEYTARPVNDARPADAMLGYDEAGLPT